eukprot:753335-Hanusia_phi.AAC.2
MQLALQTSPPSILSCTLPASFFLTTHHLPLTSHLSPLTSHLSPLFFSSASISLAIVVFPVPGAPHTITMHPIDFPLSLG